MHTPIRTTRTATHINMYMMHITCMPTLREKMPFSRMTMRIITSL